MTRSGSTPAATPASEFLALPAPRREQAAEQAALHLRGVLDELPVEGARDHEDLGGEIQGLKIRRHESSRRGLVQHRLKSFDRLLALRGQLRVVVPMVHGDMEKDIHPELEV